jgi:hypothetical protein
MIVRVTGLLGVVLSLSLAGNAAADAAAVLSGAVAADTVTPEMRIVTKVIDVRDDIAMVPMAAQKTVAGTFQGIVVLNAGDLSEGASVPKPGTAAARAVRLGSGRFSIAAGESAKVKVPLSRRGRALMRRAPHHHLPAIAVITAHVGDATPSRTRTHVTMRAGH